MDNIDPIIDLPALRAGGRDERGRFTPELRANFKTGLRADLEDLPELAVVFKAERDRITADLGDDAPTLKAGAIREAARLGVMVDSLGHDLLLKGVLTGKGRTRAALSAYTTVLDRYIKLLDKLGIERRERKVDLAASFHEAGRLTLDRSGLADSPRPADAGARRPEADEHVPERHRAGHRRVDAPHGWRTPVAIR